MKSWTVTPCIDDVRLGLLEGPGFSARVALGKGGVKPASDKREGDKASPAGRYPLRRLFYRPDRLSEPLTDLECSPLSPDQGWCDDPDDPHYNQLVRLPFGPSHEKMWREDGLYDVVLVIGHNDDPVVPGFGSAVFVHCARDDYGPTLGCVALARQQFLRFLRLAAPGDTIEIKAP